MRKSLGNTQLTSKISDQKPVINENTCKRDGVYVEYMGVC